MGAMEKRFELMEMPTSTDTRGMQIHICAALRVDAMQLRDHRIGWAADTMEQAAKHIEALEKMIVERESEVNR